LPAIGRFRPGEIGSRGICQFLSIRTVSVVEGLTKAISAMVVVAVVVTSGSAVASVAPEFQGNKCSTVGSIRTYKKVSYICTASGKKKVWQTASSSSGTAATTTDGGEHDHRLQCSHDWVREGRRSQREHAGWQPS